MKSRTLLLLIFLVVGCRQPSDLQVPNSRQRVLEGTKVTITSVTDAGMHALWNPKGFATFRPSGNEWAAEFVREVRGSSLPSIVRGHLIPINLYGDGDINVEIKIGSEGAPAQLDESQKKYQRLKSEEYLFVSDGLINLSGIEYISNSPDESVSGVRVGAGRWVSTVYFLEYSREVKNGPVLPEFVVTLNPEIERKEIYRSTEITWDEDIW